MKNLPTQLLSATQISCADMSNRSKIAYIQKTLGYTNQQMADVINKSRSTYRKYKYGNRTCSDAIVVQFVQHYAKSFQNELLTKHGDQVKPKKSVWKTVKIKFKEFFKCAE